MNGLLHVNLDLAYTFGSELFSLQLRYNAYSDQNAKACTEWHANITVNEEVII